MNENNMVYSFQVNIPFLYPLKNAGFPMFSGSIEMKHWLEMGEQ